MKYLARYAPFNGSDKVFVEFRNCENGYTLATVFRAVPVFNKDAQGNWQHAADRRDDLWNGASKQGASAMAAAVKLRFPTAKSPKAPPSVALAA